MEVEVAQFTVVANLGWYSAFIAPLFSYRATLVAVIISANRVPFSVIVPPDRPVTMEPGA
jgi:hypothetical protein